MFRRTKRPGNRPATDLLHEAHTREAHARAWDNPRSPNACSRVKRTCACVNSPGQPVWVPDCATLRPCARTARSGAAPGTSPFARPYGNGCFQPVGCATLAGLLDLQGRYAFFRGIARSQLPAAESVLSCARPALYDVRFRRILYSAPETGRYRPPALFSGYRRQRTQVHKDA